MEWRLSVLLFLTGLRSLAHCQYHFIGTTLPWLKARTYCRERYTDLATVFNIEDMNRVVNTAQDSTGGFTKKAWIGLHDNLTSWRWSFSDSSYYGDKKGDYRNWDFSQPDNFLGNQMCAKMWSRGMWDDSPCSLRNPFICYDGTAGTNQTFIFVEQDLSWSDARRYCRERHTDLASVRDEKENREIQQLAKNRSVWIGLYRTREWSDQSTSTYRYWKQGQPDNVGGKQHCTATDLGNAGLWSDEECSRELAFICHGEKVLSTTTTVTPNKITTVTGDSLSTEVTSPEQTSASLVHRTTSIPVTPNKRTTTETESTTGRVGTSSAQPLTPEVQQTSPVSDQTTHKSPHSTITKVTLNKRTTTEIESTTGHLSTEMTSFEQLSTPEVDQTRPITITPNSSSTTVTPRTKNTTEIKSTSDHVSTEMTSSQQPSTRLVEQTRPITDETRLSTSKMTTTERDSTSTDASSQPHSTPKVDQTRNVPVSYVVNLQVRFNSKKQLSEDDINKLVLLQFHKFLMEMGLPTSIKVGLKRPLK